MIASLEEIQEWDQTYRLKFINSISGYKSVHLIGTRSESGNNNIAIFNSLVHIGSNPPHIGFIMRPDTVRRDTLNNIRATKSFTINHVHKSFVRQAHYTSAKFDEDVSEFDECNLNAKFEHGFHAPFVEESKVRMAMELVDIVQLPTHDTYMVVGEIKQVFIDDDCVGKDGQLDFEPVQNVVVTGLNEYSTVKSLRGFPYARVDEIPPFGKKERSDQVVYDEETDTYTAALLPYGTNISSPSIIPADVSTWKNQGINKFNHALNNKVEQIKNKYQDLVKEFQLNELVYGCKMNFEPIIGQTYHLYKDDHDEHFLSMIPPNTWKKEFVGSFKLNHDGSWELAEEKDSE